MTRQTTFHIAIAMMLVMTSQAHAGMSGTSARIQEISNAEAEVRPKADAMPQQGASPPGSEQVQKPQPAVPPSASNFDGIWAVSSSSGCGLASRSSVKITRGHISGQGLSGSIDAAGNVRTVARGGGLSVISTGRAAANFGSGAYKVSNGCTGTWTARKA